MRPTIVGAATSTDGTSLIVTWSEALDPAHPPPPSPFTVTVDGSGRALGGAPTVSGTGVTLTLETAVLYAQTVAVSYADPSADDDADAVQDLAGNDAASVDPQTVTNRAAENRITLSSYAGRDRTYAIGDVIEVTRRFLSAATVSGTPQLDLTVGDATRPASYARGSGTRALVFAYTVAEDDADADGVSIAQDALRLNGGSIRIGDDDARLAQGVVPAQARHKVDGVRPAFDRAETSADGRSLKIAFDKALNEANGPAAAPFRVHVDGERLAALTGEAAVSGAVATLDLPVVVTAGQTVEVELREDSIYEPVRGLSGNAVVPFEKRTATNHAGDSAGPRLKMAVLDKTVLTLTWDEALDGANPPPLSAFAVSVGGSAVSLTGAPAVRDRLVTLTLASLPAPGRAVAVSYTDPSAANDAAAVQDAVGNDAASVAHRRVMRLKRVTLAVTPATVAEGGEAEVTATLDAPASAAFTVAIAAAPGADTQASDYELSATPTLSFAKGATESSGTVTVTAADNAQDDHQAKQVQVSGTLGANAPEDVGMLGARTLHIVDDDPAPRVLLRLSADPLAEDGGSTTVTAALDRPSSRQTALTVQVAPAGSATADHFSVSPSQASHTFTFAAGSTSSPASFTIVAVGNDAASPNRKVRLTGTVTSANGVVAPAALDLLIADDEGSAPAAPTGLTATASGTSVVLGWTAPTDTSAVTGYQVRVKAGDGSYGNWTDIPDSAPDGANAAGYTVTDLAGGVQHSFRVRAVSAARAGAQSDETSATPGTTDRAGPVLSRAAADWDRLTLTYGEALDTGSVPAATAYEVRVGSATRTVRSVRVAGSAVVLTLVSPVAAGEPVRVTYTVPDGADATAVQDAAGNPASPLTGQVALNVTPRVTLVLTPAAIGENGGVATVTATVRPPAARAFTLTVASAPARSRDFILSPNRRLSFAANQGASTGTVTVTALDNDLDAADTMVTVSGAVSAAARVTGPADVVLTLSDDDEAPAAPALSATGGNRFVVLAWTPPARAGSSPIGGYQYRLKRVTGSYGDWTPIPLSAPRQANAAGFAVAGLTNGTVYVFELRAVSAAGAGPSSAEAWAEARATPAVNAAPRFPHREMVRRVVEHTPVGANVGAPVVATDADGDRLTYTLGGADGGAFAVDRNSGQITAEPGTVLDYASGTTSYTVTVTAADPAGATDTATVTIEVLDVRENHLDLHLDPASITESGGVSTVSATLSAPAPAAFAVAVTAAAVWPAEARDFTLSADRTLSFNAGARASSGTVTVTAVNNDAVSAHKSVTVSGTLSGGGAGVHVAARTLTILDDDTYADVCSRTAVVRDAIFKIVKDKDTKTCGDVTQKQLATEISTLSLNNKGITSLQSGDFAGLTGLGILYLHNNQLTTLPADIFAGLPALTHLWLQFNPSLSLPAGIFAGLQLTGLYMHVDVPVTLERVSPGRFRAVVATGAPFTMTLPLTVTGGALPRGVTRVTIPAGRIASGTLAVTRTGSGAVSVDLGTLPERPLTHGGYSLGRGAGLPLEVLAAPLRPVLVLTPATIPESGVATITAELNEPAPVAFDLTVSTRAGRNARSNNYRLSAQRTLRFAKGATESSGVVTVAGVDNDYRDHADKEVQVRAAVDGTVPDVRAPANRTLTLADDDPPPVATLKLSDQSISEDGGTATVTVSLDRRSTRETLVDVSVTPDSPATTGDFSLDPSTTPHRIRVRPWRTEGTSRLTITATDNAVDAADRTLTVSGAAESDNGVVAPEPLRLRIVNDDASGRAPGLLRATVEGTTVTLAWDETLDTANPPPLSAFSVSVGGSTVSLTGSPAVSGNLVTLALAAAPAAGQTVAVTYADPTAGNDTGAVQDAAGNDAATVTNYPVTRLKTVTLVLSPAEIQESGASTITATLDRATGEPFTVLVSAAPLSAAADDFRLSAERTLRFAANETTSTGAVSIAGIDNPHDDDSAKTVSVTGTLHGAPADVGTVAAQTLTLTDDDPPPRANLRFTANPLPEDGRTTVTVALDRQSARATTVAVRVEPVAPASTGDFVLSPVGSTQTFTVDAGETAPTGSLKSFDIVAVDNHVASPNRKLRLGVEVAGDNGVTATNPVELLIQDDEGSVPGAPTGLSATPLGSSIKLVWTASADGSAITGYQYRRRAGSGTYTGWTDIPDSEPPAVNAASYTLRGLAAGVEHRFQVRALNAHGASAASDEAGATLQQTLTLVLDRTAITESGATTVSAALERPASAPFSVTVSVSAGSNAPADTAETVTLSDDPTLRFSTGARLSTRVTLSGVDNTQDDHLVKEIVVNGALSDDAPADVSDRIVPRTLSITDDDPAPRVRWRLSQDPLFEGDAAKDESGVGLELDRPSSRITTFTVRIEPVAPTTAADFQVTPAASVNVTVPAGDRSASGIATVTAVDNDAVSPNRKLRLTAAVSSANGVVAPAAWELSIADDEGTRAGRPVGFAVTPRDGAAWLTWSRPADSVPVTGYEYRAVPGAQEFPGWFDIPDSAPGQENATSYLVTGLTNGVEYAFRVRSVATGGGRASNTVKATPVAGAADPEVTVSYAAASYAAAENGGAAVVVVTLNAAPERPVAIPITKIYRGSTSGDDYSGVPASVRFGAADTAHTITVTATDDGEDDDGESLELGFGPRLPDRVSGGTPSTATVTLADDDDPEVTVRYGAASYTATERGSAAAVAVILSAAPEREVVIPITKANQGATSDGDYAGVPSSLTFGAAATAATFTVTAADDRENDDGERVTLGFGPLPDRVAAGTPSSATVTISDDGGGVSDAVVLAVEPDTVAEDVGSSGKAVEVTGTLNGTPLASATAVAVTVAGGTATAGTDFAVVSGFTLTIATGESSGTGTFTLKPVDDAVSEGDETVAVSGTATGLTVSGAEVTIGDDEAAPTVTLALGATEIGENGGSTAVTASLDHESSAETTITVSVTPESPATTADYTLSTNLALTIAAGATASTGAVTITAVDNAVDTANRTVTVSATAHNTVAVTAPGDETLTIADDDTRGVTVAPETLSVPEGDGAPYTVVLDSEPTAEVEVTVTVPSDTDVTVDETALTFTASDWATAQTVTVSAEQDDDGDDDEVTLSHAVSSSGDYGSEAAPSVAVTVDDDETASDTVTLAVDPATVAEDVGAAGEAVQVTGTLNGAPLTSATAVAVTVAGGTATAGTDFAAVSGFTLTIATGESSGTGTFTLKPVDDAVSEGDETVAVSGTATGLTVSGAEVTIGDDEAAPTVTLALGATEIGENGGSTAVTASLDHESSAETTITVSVTPESPATTADYTLSTNLALTIAAGATASTGAVTITAVDNAVDAADRTVTVSATAHNTVGVTVPGDETLTIADDDTRGVTVAPAELTVPEGGGKPYTVVLDSEPTAEVEVTVTVPASTDVTVDETALTFTAGDWATAQTVTVSAEQDDDGDDDEVTLSHAVSSSGDYGSEAAPSVAVTVDDDETASDTVTLAVDPATVAEDVGAAGEAVQVTGTLNGAPLTSATAVAVTVAGGTATAGTDFAAVSGFTLTIATGESSGTGTFTLKPVDDAVSEGDETVAVSGTATGLTVSGAEVTIGDDEAAPTVTLALGATEIGENGGSTAVTASLDHESSAETTITVSVTPESPATTADYTLSTNLALTIAAGATASTGAVTITAVDNAVDAADRTVTVSATAHNTVGVTVPGDETLTIADDDTRGVTVAPAELTVPEGGDKPYTVVLDSEPTAEVEVTVTVPASTDVTVDETALTFTAGDWATAQTVTVSAEQDDDAVDDEVTLTHAVSSSGDYGSEAAPSVAVTVDDDETASDTVTLAVDPATVAEDVGEAGAAVQVTGTLNEAPRASATAVTVTVGSGTATAATDFAAVSGFTLTIGTGKTASTATFTLKPVNDAVSEGDETVLVSGVHPDLSVTAARVTISDDEALPTVALALGSTTVGENGGSTAVTAGMSHASSAETTVTVSAAPVSPATSGDYALSSNRMLTIAAGATTSIGVVKITAVDNDVDAADRTVTVSGLASNRVGVTAPGNKTLTIGDDDTRGVTVSPSALTVAEGGDKPYTVVLASQPTADVEVTVTVPSDTDVTVDESALTFTPSTWETKQSVTVSADQDDDAVDDEVTLTHAVSSSGDYGSETAAVTVTITDDETAAAALTLVFAAPAHDDQDSSGDVTLGDVLTYIATATNSGNVPLANVTVTDLLVDTAGESCATLALEESCELSGDYTVTQANVDAGQVVNTATATADDLSDQTVTRTTTVAQKKALTLAKTTTSSSFAQVGAVLNYGYQVTNSGTVTLSGTLAITDDKIASGDITCGEVPSGGLGPAASVNCTATYTVVQADMDAAKVVNEATATLAGVTSEVATATVPWAAAQVTPPTLSVAAVGGSEQAEAAKFAVALSAASLQTVSVAYASTDGSAKAGSDYVAASGRLTLAPSTTSGTISVQVVDDNVVEGSENLTMTLTSASNATVADDGAAALGTITDNDQASYAVAAGAAAIAEDGGAAAVTVSTGGVSFPALQEFTLTFGGTASKGTDYTVGAERLTLSVGQSSVATTVTARDDARDEANETVTVSALLGGSAVGSLQTITITDDDTRGVTVDPTELTVAEGGDKPYTVVLASQPTADVEVSVTVPGATDVSASPAALTFTASDWETAQTVTVSAGQDGDTADDTATVAHAVSGGDYGSVTAASVTVTVDDDDEPNTAPTASNGTVTTAEDTTYEFKPGDFNFMDADAGDRLEKVKIVTLPAVGSLTVGDRAVAANEEVAGDGRSLRYAPAANGNGDGYASFTFKVGDGTALSASAYAMTIDVSAVNDPATGAPTITGAARVGQTLTADLGDVADVDGLPEHDPNSELLLGSELEWQWVRVDGSAPACTQGGCRATETEIEGATDKTYVLTAADAGKQVKVTVSFTDQGGTRETRASSMYPWSAVFGSNPLVAPGESSGEVPGAPTALTTLTGNRSVTLSWTAPSGSVSGYEYRVCKGSATDCDPDAALSGYGRWYATGGVATTHTVYLQVAAMSSSGKIGTVGLENGTQYTFQVRAENANGKGAASAEASATPNPSLAAPTAVEATPGDRQVKLSWTAPSVSVSGYEYRVCEGTAAQCDETDEWHLYGNGRGYPGVPNEHGLNTRGWLATGSTSTTVTVTEHQVARDRKGNPMFFGLQNGTTYSFQVRAVSATDRGAASAEVEATPAAAAPLPQRQQLTARLTGTVPESQPDESCRVNVEVKILGVERTAVAVQLAAGDFTVTGGRLGEPVAAEDGLSWTVPAWAAAELTGLLRVKLTETDERAAAQQAFRVTGGTSCEPVPRGELAALEVAGAELAPAFSGQVTAYGATVAHEVARVTVTARPFYTDAQVMIEPVDADGEAEDHQVALGAGDNTITVAAWGPGGDAQVYVVTVRRAAAGEAALSVADTSVREGPAAVLAFPVTLDRQATAAVTVGYASADGTATAGTDYTAVSGTLTFAVGATARTVTVAVRDDDLNEGSETLTLTLSDAAGAWLARRTATGTIVNTDPLPAAWLARFGRTAADQVLRMVDGRLHAARQAGLAATVAGHRLPAAAPATDAQAHEQALAAVGTEPAAWEPEEGGRADGRVMTLRELLSESELQLATPVAGGTLTLWAGGALTGFEGREEAEDLEVSGEVWSALVGADYAAGGWLAGLAVAYSDGGGGRYGSPVGAGEVGSWLLGGYPYLSYTTGPLTLWGAAGYGRGMLTLTPAGEEPLETAVRLLLGAGGARGELLAPADAGGLTLAVNLDGRVLRTGTERVTGLAAAEAEVSRLRLALEGGTVLLLGGAGLLSPTLEVGVRHDAGDAERGLGVDLSGRLDWSAPGLGLAAQVSGRALLVHEADGLAEWGVAGALGYDPDPGSELGPALRLAPEWGGSAAGGAEGLWTRPTLAGLAAGGAGTPPAARLQVEASWGLPLFGGVGTPYLGLGLAGAGRDYRLGYRVSVPVAAGAALTVNLEGIRREPIPAATATATGTLNLNATLRW